MSSHKRILYGAVHASLPEISTRRSIRTCNHKTVETAVCQVKSKWLQELRKGNGHGKENKKEISHGGLDHLELLKQGEQHLQNQRVAHRVRKSELRGSDPYAEKMALTQHQ